MIVLISQTKVQGIRNGFYVFGMEIAPGYNDYRKKSGSCSAGGPDRAGSMKQTCQDLPDKEKEKIINEKTGGKSQQKIYVPVCHFGTDLSLTCDKDTCCQVKNTDNT